MIRSKIRANVNDYQRKFKSSCLMNGQYVQPVSWKGLQEVLVNVDRSGRKRGKNVPDCGLHGILFKRGSGEHDFRPEATESSGLGDGPRNSLKVNESLNVILEIGNPSDELVREVDQRNPLFPSPTT